VRPWRVVGVGVVGSAIIASTAAFLLASITMSWDAAFALSPDTCARLVIGSACVLVVAVWLAVASQVVSERRARMTRLAGAPSIAGGVACVGAWA
jgi:hypothetical protein